MLLWCSIIVVTSVSPDFTNFSPQANLTRLDASVVPLTKTSSLGTVPTNRATLSLEDS